jgi:hypothetical protein
MSRRLAAALLSMSAVSSVPALARSGAPRYEAEVRRAAVPISTNATQFGRLSLATGRDVASNFKTIWKEELYPGPTINTQRKFDEVYALAHRQGITRALHLAGTVLAPPIALAAGALAHAHGASLGGSLAWSLAGPATGYALAWGSHIFGEGNLPETWRHPIKSLLGDTMRLGRGLKVVPGTMIVAQNKLRSGEARKWLGAAPARAAE